mgnify:FL=1
MAGDALNVMTVPEGVGSDGDARSNRGDGRYGDYAQITLDPTDDLTFWHIGEYMKGSASTVRRSRVVAFRLGTATPDTEAPTTPTNLAASNVGSSSVTLSWTASTDNIGVAGYDIYNGGSVIASAAGSATSFNVTGLSPTTAYAFSIRAKDAAGNQSAASNTVNVTTTDVSACTGGITSFPYSEGFEGNIGAWTQATGDDLNWTVQSGGTPSNNTGPSGAAAGSNYIFVEASGDGTGFPNKSAIINSPCYDLSGVTQATFSFQYHMFGAADMGTIALEASNDNGVTWTSIWSQTGNQGNQWNSVDVDLASYVGNGVQLRFNRVTGGTWQADIAIDDVQLTSGSTGGGGSCTAQVATFPYSQGFESGIGQWSQNSGDDLDWTVDANGTPSNNTGPGSATEGSNYIFVEASGNGTGYPNKAAIITSPCFDLTSASQASFSFAYHMFGAADMGTIALEASTDNGATWTSIWNQSGNQGNQWNTETVDLAAYVGGTVQLRFNRVTGGTWQADIALDDISLTTGGSNGGGGNCAPSGNLTLTITFDNYPEETSWQVTNAGGSVVASNSYSTANPDGSTVNETISLADGDYTFTINDAFGDGICCQFGNGSYTLTDAGNGTIVSGGSFTSSEATTFCLGNRSAGATRVQTQILDISQDITLYPNPANSVLNIDTKGANIESVKLYSMYGRSVEIGTQDSQAQMRSTLSSNSFNISNLPAGVYFLRVKTPNGEITKRFVKK